MSAPVPEAPKSFLDDLAEYVDIQEDDTGVKLIREHFVVRIHMQIHASDIPENLLNGAERDSIEWTVGDITKQKNAPTAGNRKFMCVEDAVSPIEHPGEWCIRRQTWEVFGGFIPAPAGWGSGSS